MAHALTGWVGLAILVVAGLTALAADLGRQWRRPEDASPRQRVIGSWVRRVSLLAVLLTALGAVATVLRLFALT